MNRPPKKKKQHKDSLYEDPRFEREELETAAAHKSSKAEGDDRNIVEIDEAFAEADFEDRMWLFWNKNKTGIIAGIVIAVLGVVGINSWKMIQRNQEIALQQDYSAAVGDMEKLQSFGIANDQTILGGLALLESADAKYKEGDFTAAIGLYQQSLPALQESVVVGRARLGVAMSQIKAGQVDAGKNTLKSMLETDAILSSIRAEAAIELAQLELAEGNRDAAKSLLDRVEKMQNAEYWQSRARSLIQMERLDVETES